MVLKSIRHSVLASLGNRDSAIDPYVYVIIFLFWVIDGSGSIRETLIETRVELLPGFKFTDKMVKIMEFTGKIGKTGKR
jgi:hypothetical protein